MSEWQRIETAPIGREVLIFWDKIWFGKRRVGDRIHINANGSVFDLAIGIEDGPTHWMPLPKPPENKS